MRRTSPSATHGLFTRLASVAAMLTIVFAGAATNAQVRDVEPYHVVATGDRVYLRCGAGGVWYAIGYVDTGDVLRVDGEDFKWVRVEYPEGMPALVSVEESDFDAARGVVVIHKLTRLKAHNIHGQRFGDSWKNLLMKPLNPGTELAHLDTLRDADGQVEGYLVEAPRGARAFLSEQYTRRATAAEIRAHRAAQLAKIQGEQPTAAPQQANAETTTPHTDDASRPTTTAMTDDQTRNEAPMEPSPANTTPVTTDDATSTDTTVADAGAETTPQTTAPTESDPIASNDESTQRTEPQQPELGQASDDALAADSSNDTPIETTPPASPVDAAPAPVQTTTAPEPQIPTFEELEASFAALTKEPIETAEIAPLIAEYTRFGASIPDTEDNSAWRTRIANRIALLEVRQDLQENMRELNSANAEADEDAIAIQVRLRQLDRTRPYALVGRLTASALYDGQRLPLMYRLQSVDAGGGRTIAYLVPSPDVDLNGRLGSIVGVEGASRVDPALKLRIVTPSRVDRLTPMLTRVTETDEQ